MCAISSWTRNTSVNQRQQAKISTQIYHLLSPKTVCLNSASLAKNDWICAEGSCPSLTKKSFGVVWVLGYDQSHRPLQRPPHGCHAQTSQPCDPTHGNIPRRDYRQTRDYHR